MSWGASLLAGCLALGLSAGRAHAGDAEAATAPSGGGRMRAVVAGADTAIVPYAWRDVLPVTIEELEKNHWTIQRSDTVQRRLVTHWKPLKHVLVRVFLGEVQARCAIDFEPLDTGGTKITMRGALASEEDLEQNPGYPSAQRTYQTATEKFLLGVRKHLDEEARKSN